MFFKTKNLLSLLLAFTISMPVIVFAAEYRVSSSTSVVDGNYFCGGSACTSSDVIIIEGGFRGPLKFQNLNGNGAYITITNESTDPNSQVVIENIDGPGPGLVSLSNCKYIDLRGDGDSDLGYGIKIFHDTYPVGRSGSIMTEYDNDFVKIRYIEIENTGTDASLGTSCIHLNSSELDQSVTMTNWEIHNNYLHGCRYAGMYLGNNDPDYNDNPYLSNFYIHHNIFEDMGAYGVTLKGINGGTSSIAYNIVRRTGYREDLTHEYYFGLASGMHYNGADVSIHHNRLEHTRGAGLLIGGANSKLYENQILGCGWGNAVEFGHGIIVQAPWTNNVEIYDNIIVQAGRYGAFSRWGTTNNFLNRNIIAGSGIGEYSGADPASGVDGGFIEGTGSDQNIYEENVSDVNFPVWSDDGNYANDVFKALEPPTLKIANSN
jgi:hypothetical protein